MPGYDGTGPNGMGARTGGGFGYCPPGAGPVGRAAVRGLGRGGLPWGGGRGFGFGGGRGRGVGRGFRGAAVYGPPASAGVAPVEDERRWLREQAEAMRQNLADVEQRLADLDGPPSQPQTGGAD